MQYRYSLVPLALEAEARAPALLPLEPFHARHAAGVVGAQGVLADQLDARSVDIVNLIRYFHIITAATLCLAVAQVSDLRRHLSAAVAAAQPAVVSAVRRAQRLERRQLSETAAGQVVLAGPRQQRRRRVAAAGARSALAQVARADDGLVPAVAAAPPRGVASDVLRAVKHGQHAEALTRQVEPFGAVPTHRTRSLIVSIVRSRPP